MEEFRIKIYEKEIVIKRDSDGKFIKPDIIKDLETKGTATKPAHEPIIMARKPLSEKTIVANVLKYGTGAIDIDGCRIPTIPRTTHKEGNKVGKYENEKKFGQIQEGAMYESSPLGRFPANIIVSQRIDIAINDLLDAKEILKNNTLI